MRVKFHLIAGPQLNVVRAKSLRHGATAKCCGGGWTQSSCQTLGQSERERQECSVCCLYMSKSYVLCEPLQGAVGSDQGLS